MNDQDFIPPADSALVLLDFQYEFLDDRGRMPVSRAHVAPTLEAARRAVAHYKASGLPIVAVGNEFKPGDHLMNLLRRFASLTGSVGSRWDPRLPINDAVYFPKWAASAFVNPEFDAWLKTRGVTELVMTGMFASACVSATTRDALRHGYRVRLLSDAIACSNDRTKARSIARLVKAGAALAA
jgi:nicotinamidase-related amidase